MAVTFAQGYTVTIGGQAVTCLAGTLKIHNEIGQRSTCEFTVYDTAQTVWYNGARISITRSSDGGLLYSGFLDSDSVTKPGFAPLLLHDIQCRDWHYFADKRVAFRSYLNTNAGAIVLDLFNGYLASEGITIGAIAQGATLPEVIVNYGYISQAFDSLAQQSGYWWEIDEEGKLYFLPYTGRPAPWVFDGSQADQAQDVTLVRGNSQYVNRQYVKGAFDKTGLLTEAFAGNGTRTYLLSYEVSEVKSVVINGAYQQLGTKSIDTGKQVYYAVGDAALAIDPSQPLYGGGATIVVTYKGRFPVVALAQNAGLIAEQQSREGVGTGYVESVYSDAKLHTLSAAFGIAASMLAHYGQDMTALTFTTPTPGLKQGQLLTAVLPSYGADMANRSMLVRSVDITDSQDGLNLWYTVEAIGSPYDVTWQSFFTNLVNQSDDPADPLTIGDQSTLVTLTPWSATTGGPVVNSLSTTTGTALIPALTTYPGTTIYPG